MSHGYSLPALLSGALRAGIDLAAARIELRRIKPHDVVERNRRVAEHTVSPALPSDACHTCDKAAFFISRMANRVPWRSDCLVQALAGQRWLARSNCASEIIVGAARRPDGSLEAHAWLRQGSRIVLGGDISTFQPLIDPGNDQAPFKKA